MSGLDDFIAIVNWPHRSELQAIEEAYLYCAAYKNMNDPMEGRYYSSKRLKSSAKYLTFRSEILLNKRQIGICPFSEVCDNELMWAHYASEFRGICIAYDLVKLLKHLLGDTSFVRMYYNEVVGSVGLTKTPPDELAKMVLSYKNHRWLYEREWRMFSEQGNVFYHDPNVVVRVYIGSRIGSSQRHKIEERLRPLKIPISTMDLSGYSISFTPLPR